MGLAGKSATFMRKAKRGLHHFLALVLAVSTLSAISVVLPQSATAATAGSGNCVQTYTLTGTGQVDVSESGGYCYVAFKNTGEVDTQATYSWTRPAGLNSVDVLVVGGGGSGGARHGGGGGAGGFVQTDAFAISSAATVSIAVGAGGNGSTSLSGTNGQTSYFKSSTNGLTALGGGAGANAANAGSGGSGGGSGYNQTAGSVTAQTQTTFSGTTVNGINFGSSGAAGANDTNASGDNNDYWAGGGGGGAGGAGANPKSNGTLVTTFPNGSNATAVGGKGGDGKSVSWISTTIATALSIGHTSSSTVYFAGGGGGGIGVDGLEGGPGGLGGGATGSRIEATGNAGMAFTGGGGGGSGFDDINKAGSTTTVSAADAGDGGSGIVVIRYQIRPAAPSITSITGGSNSLSVAFTPASDGITISGYKFSTDGGSTWSASNGSTSSPISITGLSNGTTYSVQIRSVSNYWDGVATASSSATAGSSCTRSTNVSGGYTTITFTSVGECIWTIPAGISSAEILAVGGGGGGGLDGGSGGGGGALQYSASYSLSGITALTISLGAGGNGGTWTPSASATAGGSTFIKNAGTTLFEAKGGSGGRGWTDQTAIPGGTSGTGGTFTAGQNGGLGPTNCTALTNTGGTGTYNLGNSPSGSAPSNSITGSAVSYGGGGGGGAGFQTDNTGQSRLGAAGGGTSSGGRGSSYKLDVDGTTAIDGASRGQNGFANSGGGGGGGSACNAYVSSPSSAYDAANGFSQRTSGGNGGSGVVILKYINAPSISLSSSTISSTVGTPISSYAITNSGGSASSYSISPSLNVSGLSFSSSTGLISGTPTANANATTYTITSTNSSGSSTAIFSLSSSYSTCSPTTSTAGGYTTVTFTTVIACAWSIPTGISTAEVLVVGGGGGGGANVGSGGAGAGAYYNASLSLTAGATSIVKVGAGGTAGTYTPNSPNGGDGDSSTFGTGTSTITSAGGGGGKTHWQNLICAGSTVQSAVSNDTGGSHGGSLTGKGGLGGASPSTTGNGANGGAGVSVDFGGSGALIYGAGGGGGAWSGTGGKAGNNVSNSGGGNGGTGSGSAGSDGIANRGGGGGGGELNCAVGGAGGSGVVKVRYLNAPSITLSSSTISATVGSSITSYTITNSGGTAASFSISPSLASNGTLSFSSSTGLLSGTPNTVSSSVTYTITATNTSGTATANFTLTSAYSVCSPSSSSASGYTTLTFTTIGSCSWSTPTNITALSVAVIGGGGGGGFGALGAGGGAGEVLVTGTPTLSATTVTGTSTIATTPGTSNVITIGSGGTSGAATNATATDGATMWNGTTNPGTAGGNGMATSFGSVQASGGGGGGGSNVRSGAQGGSGGGAALAGTGGAAGSGTAPNGWTSFRNAGAGTGSSYPGYGGGGGAGGAGTDSRGGSGITVFGVRVAGGGAGWGYLGSENSLTDTGLGGNGRLTSGNWGYAGTSPNWTSPGANGTGTGGGAGAPGGSGAVIIRYANIVNYSYDANGGTGSAPASGSIQGGTTFTSAANPFTRTGYTFAGWYTTASGTGGNAYSANASNTMEVSATSVTLYAKWSSTDSTLSSLALSSGTLSPTFDSATSSYTASVSNTTTSITVTPTRNQANATITVNGTSVNSGSASGPISLNVGSNTITVVVTAQDGTSISTYTVTVTRPGATLSSPTSLAVTAISGAASAVTVTFSSVSNASSYSIQLFNSGGAQIGSDLVNFTSGNKISGLASGTSYSVKVIAIGNGSTYLDSAYSSAVNFTTSASNVLNFAGTSNQYASTTNSIIPTTGNFTVEAWISPTEYNSTRNVPVIASQGTGASNRIYIKLNLNGYLVVYQDGGLVEITCSNSPIPLNIWSHIAVVAELVSSTRTLSCYVNGVLQNKSSTSALGGNTIGSGFYVGAYAPTPGYAAALFAGKIDEVKIWNIARTQSDIQNNMELAPVLSTSGLVAYYPFDASTGTSAVELLNSSSNLTLQTTLSWLPLIRTISYGAGTYGSGSTASQSSANDHTSAITLKNASGASGITRTGYVISSWNTNAGDSSGTSYSLAASYNSSASITLYPTWTGTNSSLSSLILSSGTLSPTFTSDTTTYTASVVNSTTSITVTPTVLQANSTIGINGSSATSGSASSGITLNVGSNTITVVVTAQDGTTTTTYTITVTRASSNVATLSALTISSGTLSPTFTSNTISYTASVVNAVATGFTVTPTVTQANATAVQYLGSSGTTSFDGALSVGANLIRVVVTAQDGTTTNTYTITVTRAAQFFTISYAAGTGGSGTGPTSPTNVNDGATFTTPANTYSRTGYTFAGWSDGTNTYAASATYPVSGVVSGNVTLTAIWTANTNTVTFNTQGGTSISSQSWATGSTLNYPTQPTRAGYSFNAWYDSSTAGSQVGRSGLSFDGTNDRISIPHAAIFNFSNQLTIEAWINTRSTGETYVTTKGDSSFYIRTFNGKAEFYLNSSAGQSSNSGWLSSTATINDGTWHHIAATYDGSTMKIYVDGVLSGSKSFTQTLKTGSESVEIGSRAGSFYLDKYFSGRMYDIRYWNVARTVTEINESMNSVLTGSETGLVAAYQLNQGTPGGTNTGINSAESVVSSSNNGTLSGFSLTGVTSNWVQVGNFYSPTNTSSFTLYAQWTGLPLTVTYNAQGGTSVSNGTVNAGASITSAPTAPTRTGYTLSGWSATNNGTVITFPYAHEQTANFTLYAIWAPNSLTITYDEQGGSSISDGTVSVGASISAAPTPPTRSGYTLSGWSTTSTGSIVSFPYAHGQTSNFTLYAIWSADSCSPTSTTTGGYTIYTFNTARTCFWTVPNGVTDVEILAVAGGGGGGYAWDNAGAGGGAGGQVKTGTATLSTTLEVTVGAGGSAGITTARQGGSGGNSVVGSITALGGGGGCAARATTCANSAQATSIAAANGGAGGAGGASGKGGGGSNTTGSVTSSTTGGTGTASGYSGTSVTYGVGGAGGTARGLITSTNITGTAGSANTGNGGGGASAKSSSGDVNGGAGGSGVVVIRVPSALTVSFDSQGGSSVSDTSTVTAGIIASAPTAPTRSNYNFLGWFTAASGGSAISFPYSHGQTANFTLYAQWSLSTYSIVFNANNGSGTMANQTVTHGVAANLNANLYSRANYVFYQWATAADGSGTTYSNLAQVTLTAGTTLYAQWTANTYVVTYAYNSATGGNSTTTSSFTTGGTTITLPTPTRTGYTFGGWYSDAGLSTSIGAAGASYSPTGATLSLNAYAKWTAINYTFTYDSNSADSGTVPTETSKQIGQTATVKANTGTLVRTGYTFSGWNTQSNGSGTNYLSGSIFTVASSNVTLYAKWSANTYTVTYNTNGGTGNAQRSSSNVTSDDYTTGGSSISLPAVGTLQRAGYTFGGWNTSAAGTGTTYAAADNYTTVSNTTLYTKWNAITYSITYNGNTSTGGTTPTSGGYTTGQALPYSVASNTFTKTSHVFGGWNTAANGSGTNYSSGSGITTLADVVLYAIWIPQYTLHYAINGGSVTSGSLPSDTLYNAGTSVGPVFSAVARTGYTFGGWLNGATTIAANGSFSIVEDSVLTAIWTPINYTISYNSDGGTEPPASTTKQINQSHTVGSAPSKPGYNFNGWNNGSSTVGAGAVVVTGASDVSYTAQWVPKVYTVSYDWNGGRGTAVNDVNYTFGTTAITLPTVGDRVKDGYTFAGWSESANGSALNATYIPSQSRTLYALWNVGNFTLTYDAGRGTVANTSVLVANGGSTVLPLPTRANFTFDGWHSAVSGGSRVGSHGDSFTPSASQTVYARWIQNSLYGITNSLNRIGSVTTVSNIGNTFSGANANSSVAVSVPANALPAGTTINFDLVSDSSRATGVISNINYLVSIALSWLTGDETVPDTGSDKPISVTISNALIKAGAAAYAIVNNVSTLLGTATQDGTITVSITSDPEIVIAAVKPGAPTSVSATSNGNQQSTISWTAPTSDGGSAITGYTVTANTGATCTTSTTSCTISSLSNGTAYTFTVTATNTVGTSAASSSASATTASLYSVTFDSKGGTSVSNGSFLTASTVSAPTAPTRTGYSFAGWSATDGGSSVSFPYAPGVTTAITLYARWDALDNVVTFDSKGGSDVTASVFSSGGTVTEPTAPTRSGYTFAGWSATDGGSLVTFPYAPGVVTDITLYAKWTVVSQNNSGGGNSGNSNAGGNGNSSNQAGVSNSGRGNVSTVAPLTVVGDASTKVPTVEIAKPANGSDVKPVVVKVDKASEKIIAEVKVVEGKLELTPETGFSGKRVVTVTITEDGKDRFVQIPLTVLPEPVTKPVLTPMALNRSLVRWSESPNADAYTVYLNGKKVCTTSALSCSVKSVLGPEANMEIVSNGADRTVSQRIAPEFRQNNPVTITRIVSATITKATLTRVDTKALDKVVALIKSQGFGTVVISEITTTGKTKALAEARIAAIKKYIDDKTGSREIIFEVVPASSRTYFNNISVKG